MWQPFVVANDRSAILDLKNGLTDAQSRTVDSHSTALISDLGCGRSKGVAGNSVQKGAMDGNETDAVMARP